MRDPYLYEKRELTENPFYAKEARIIKEVDFISVVAVDVEQDILNRIAARKSITIFARRCLPFDKVLDEIKAKYDLA